LIVEKDKGMPEKEDRPTKHIFKTLLTINTQEATSKHHIKTKAHQINSEKFEDSHFLYN